MNLFSPFIVILFVQRIHEGFETTKNTACSLLVAKSVSRPLAEVEAGQRQAVIQKALDQTQSVEGVLNPRVLLVATALMKWGRQYSLQQGMSAVLLSFSASERLPTAESLRNTP